MPYTYPYPRPSLTVDCVVFGFDPRDEKVRVLLIKRGDNVDTFPGFWALPGGFVNVSDTPGAQGEPLEVAARRECEEETGAKIAYLEQLGTFGTPERDPRGRVVSVAYYALVRTQDHAVQGGDDASEARWFSIDEALALVLAFDHNEILRYGISRLQSKVKYAPVGFGLLPEVFSLLELRRLYEALLGRPLDAANFRKKILGLNFLTEADKKFHGRKVIQLYRFNQDAYNEASRLGFNFEPRYVREKAQK